MRGGYFMSYQQEVVLRNAHMTMLTLYWTAVMDKAQH